MGELCFMYHIALPAYIYYNYFLLRMDKDAKVCDPNEWVQNDEIPEDLKKLTKLILKAFYDTGYSLGTYNSISQFL